MIWVLLIFVLLAMLFLPNRSPRAASRRNLVEPEVMEMSDEEILENPQLDLLNRYGVSGDADQLRAMGIDPEGLGYREDKKG